MEHLIKIFNQQIEAIDDALRVALASDEAWATSAQRLQTVIDIGPLAATWLLVSTLNFTLCPSAQALVAYAGLAPHPFQSGSSIHARPRIGHTGNARLRTIFYMGALSEPT